MSDMKPRAYPVRTLHRETGIPRTKWYQWASEGRITFRKAGRISIVLADDLDRLLASLPPAPIRLKPAA